MMFPNVFWLKQKPYWTNSLTSLWCGTFRTPYIFWNRDIWSSLQDGNLWDKQCFCDVLRHLRGDGNIVDWHCNYFISWSPSGRHPSACNVLTPLCCNTTHLSHNIFFRVKLRYRKPYGLFLGLFFFW